MTFFHLFKVKFIYDIFSVVVFFDGYIKNPFLCNYITKYDGRIFKGVYITISGLLAGAHLTGAGGVIDFFENTGKYDQYDGNNIHVSEYIKEFSGFDILAYIE